MGWRQADPDPAGAARGGGAPRWIETEAFFQFHFANGFEQDGAIVLDLTRYPDFGTVGDALRNYWHSEWSADGMAALVRLRIDLATGTVARHAFPTGNANEFPRINPRYVATRHRYVYIANNPADQGIGLQQRITRVDLESGATVSHDFAPHGYPGEPVFIPAQPRRRRRRGVRGHAGVRCCRGPHADRGA